MMLFFLVPTSLSTASSNPCLSHSVLGAYTGCFMGFSPAQRAWGCSWLWLGSYLEGNFTQMHREAAVTGWSLWWWWWGKGLLQSRVNLRALTYELGLELDIWTWCDESSPAVRYVCLVYTWKLSQIFLPPFDLKTRDATAFKNTKPGNSTFSP